jgi:hypothetical protein
LAAMPKQRHAASERAPEEVARLVTGFVRSLA